MPASLCLALPASLMSGGIRETHEETVMEINMKLGPLLKIGRDQKLFLDALNSNPQKAQRAIDIANKRIRVLSRPSSVRKTHQAELKRKHQLACATTFVVWAELTLETLRGQS